MILKKSLTVNLELILLQFLTLLINFLYKKKLKKNLNLNFTKIII